MNQKFWLCFCIVFSIFSIKLLIDDYYDINYIILRNDSEPDITNYLLCTPFKQIQQFDKLNRSENVEMVSIRTFLNYSLSSIEKNLKDKNLLELKDKPLFKLNETFIYRNQICFTAKKSDFENFSFLDPYLSIYETFMFVFSNGKKPFQYECIYIHGHNNQKKIYLKISKQKIYSLDYLSNPNCVGFQNQFNNSLFNCVNKCFIRFNHFLGFYSLDDNGEFDLSLIRNKKTGNELIKPIKFKSSKSDEIQLENSQVKQIEFDDNLANCLKRCNQIKDCYLETYDVAIIRESYYEKIIAKENIDKITLHSILYQEKYSTTDFWLQFFGLLTLFTNTSIVSLVPFLIRLFAKKIKKHQHQYFVFIFPKFKIFLIIFSLFFVLIQSVLMYQEYRYKLAYPDETNAYRFTSEFEPFSMVICLPIETIINNDTIIKKNRNAEIISSKTLNEIKNETNNGFEKIRTIDLNYGFNYDHYKWREKLSKKVIFRNIEFDNQTCLSRCFLIDIDIQERRYESLLPMNTLSIDFKTKFWRVYLLTKDQQFDSLTNYFHGEFYAGKLKRKNSLDSSYSNCMYYEEDSKLNCRTRRHCIDKCINELYIKKYFKLPLYSIVEMNDLNSSLDSLYFRNEQDHNIEKRCNEIHIKTDCIETYFYESLQTTYFYEENRMVFNLNFEKIIEKELEQSWVKLVLNIINLESIFFGSNVASLLMAVFMYIKKIFKFKYYRIYRIVIFLICLIGFIVHNTFIFTAIIQDPLIDNGYFKKFENFHLVNPIFCFQIDQKSIDKNHKLTGNYLNLLSKDKLSYDKVFDLVWFYNKTHRNFFSPKETGNQNSEISITHFYYLNLKCFEFNLKVTFNEEDLYFIDTKNLLGIYFQPNFTNQYEDAYFLFRENNKTKQFSNNFRYKIKINDTFFVTYMIEFENFVVEEDDKFEILKNLKKLFIQNINIRDSTVYLDNMIKNFNKNYRLTTTEILLESYENGIYELEIDENLFEQYFLQIQNVSDHKYPSSENSKQNFYNAYTEYNENKYKKNGFVFSLSQVKRKSKITNEDNYTKLIQQIINALSLWLNISILEIYIYFNKIPKPNIISYLNQSNRIYRIYRILIRLKFYFKNKCCSHFL